MHSLIESVPMDRTIAMNSQTRPSDSGSYSSYSRGIRQLVRYIHNDSVPGIGFDCRPGELSYKSRQCTSTHECPKAANR